MYENGKLIPMNGEQPQQKGGPVEIRKVANGWYVLPARSFGHDGLTADSSVYVFNNWGEMMVWLQSWYAVSTQQTLHRGNNGNDQNRNTLP